MSGETKNSLNIEFGTLFKCDIFSLYFHRILGGCFGRCLIIILRDKLNFYENKRKSICGINKMLYNGNYFLE